MWEHKGGLGLWQQWVNSDTGEKSLHEHTPKLVKEWCADHTFLANAEIPKNRLISCIVCGQEVRFVVGFHELVDGKIRLRKKS